MSKSTETAAYDLTEHRHRFAVWAAARAAQRGFTGVAALRRALESCGVVEYLRTRNLDEIDGHEFKARHREWCRAIRDDLAGRGLANATFGRAAKLLAVYLKSFVILGPQSGTVFARVAHPPIDSILLRGLCRSSKGSAHAAAWAIVKWTTLGEDAYYELIDRLRQVPEPGEPFWMIERYWTVTSDAVDGG